MSKQKNQRHKENRKREEEIFQNNKISFIVGILSIFEDINDVICHIIQISSIIIIIESSIILVLFNIALTTKKIDSSLKHKNIANFVSFSSIMSVVEFTMSKLLFYNINTSELVFNVNNIYFQRFLIFAIINAVIVICSLYLLFYKHK